MCLCHKGIAVRTKFDKLLLNPAAIQYTWLESDLNTLYNNKIPIEIEAVAYGKYMSYMWWEVKILLQLVSKLSNEYTCLHIIHLSLKSYNLRTWKQDNQFE